MNQEEREEMLAQRRHRTNTVLLNSQIEIAPPNLGQSDTLRLNDLSAEDIKQIKFWLIFMKEGHNRHATIEYPPYRYMVNCENTSIVISGHPENDSPHKNVDDLIDVVEVLGKHLTYINPEKTESLLKQLDELRLARIIERDKKIGRERRHRKQIAQGQEKHREKYLRLAEKYGLDPNLIFANPESALKKSPASIPADSRKSPKTK